MPAISIVIPTYRRPLYLREALWCALTQTWSDLEVLVCDNGADEITRDIVESCADPRIRYIPRPHDLGMLRNAVRGFQEATGDFVVKLDDDDRLAPEALERLVTPLLTRPEVTLSFAKFHLIDPAGRPLPEQSAADEQASGRAHLTPGPHSPGDALVASGAVGLVCAMTRHDAVDWDDIPDGVATAYDRHIALQAVRDARPVWFVPERLADYRLHAASDSAHSLTRQLLGSLYATELAIASGRHRELDAMRAHAAQTAVAAGRLLLREGRTTQAREVLWRAMAHYPAPPLARLAALSCLPGPLAQHVSTARHDAHLRRMAAGPAAVGHEPIGPATPQEVERVE